MAPRKPSRLRGHDLALELDRTGQYQAQAESRIAQSYLSESDKTRLGIPLNAYDAARSYREQWGLQDTPLREILKDERFRTAWGTFKGGYRWEGERRLYKKEGGIYSTTKEKLAAAKTLGWYDSKKDAIDHIRQASP